MLGTYSQIDQNKTSAADINTSSLSQNMPLGQSLESWNEFYHFTCTCTLREAWRHLREFLCWSWGLGVHWWGKKILDSFLTDTILGTREIRIVDKCVLSVILFIVNKYKEYSLRLIIVLIIDLTDNMWLLYTTMNLSLI